MCDKEWWLVTFRLWRCFVCETHALSELHDLEEVISSEFCDTGAGWAKMSKVGENLKKWVQTGYRKLLLGLMITLAEASTNIWKSVQKLLEQRWANGISCEESAHTISYNDISYKCNYYRISYKQSLGYLSELVTKLEHSMFIFSSQSKDFRFFFSSKSQI